MGWDAGRPVPWARLIREWLIYAAIMTVVFALFFRGDGGLLPILAGLAVSGPLYLAFGAVLAKFGYQRKTLGQGRAARASSASTSGSAGDGATAVTERARPAPTRRTSAGSNRPNKRRR